MFLGQFTVVNIVLIEKGPAPLPHLQTLLRWQEVTPGQCGNATDLSLYTATHTQRAY